MSFRSITSIAAPSASASCESIGAQRVLDARRGGRAAGDRLRLEAVHGGLCNGGSKGLRRRAGRARQRAWWRVGATGSGLLHPFRRCTYLLVGLSGKLAGLTHRIEHRLADERRVDGARGDRVGVDDGHVHLAEPGGRRMLEHAAILLRELGILGGIPVVGDVQPSLTPHLHGAGELGGQLGLGRIPGLRIPVGR
jgi:hypothetical protein